MKKPGDYALEHANGASWADIVAEIREEAVADYRQVPYRDGVYTTGVFAEGDPVPPLTFVCELPHETIDEENACEKTRSAEGCVGRDRD